MSLTVASIVKDMLYLRLYALSLIGIKDLSNRNPTTVNSINDKEGQCRRYAVWLSYLPFTMLFSSLGL